LFFKTKFFVTLCVSMSVVRHAFLLPLDGGELFEGEEQRVVPLAAVAL